MKMILVWIFTLSLRSCFAVIYHLNDTEYQRMPPLFSMDEYDSCLVEESSSYCVLKLELYAEPGNQLMRIITEYSDHTPKHYNYSNLDRGICVRHSCPNYTSTSKTTVDLKSSLEACLSEYMRREYGLNSRLSTLYYCDRHNESWHIDAWDWTVLIFILGLMIINIIGSAYDYIVNKQRKQALKQVSTLLLSFSIMRNWKRLLDTESIDPRMSHLKFLNGIRVISNLLTILMHAVMSFTVGFAGNPHDIEKAFDIPSYLLLFNGMMVVQLFFFMSGFLAVYHLRIEEHKLTFTIWDVPKIMLQRISRLVPSLAMTLALATTWVRHAGSGPLWKMFVTGSLVADCRNYWWRHLFFYNNYLDDSKFCLVPTWQLAAEMQVFLVCVTTYILTRGQARRALLGTLLLLGVAAPALHTLLQDLDAVFITPQSFRTLNIGGTFWRQHAPGHTNLPCFIIGMVTAARLFDWQKKGSYLVKSKWYTMGQYLSVATFLLILATGCAFYTDGPRAPLAARVAYTLAIRPLLGLACMLIFTTFFMKNPSFIKSILEWRQWAVLSRLTYCVFLLHMILVNMTMGTRSQLSHFSFFNIVVIHLFVVVVTYIISVPFTLMVESPFIVLFKSVVRQPSSHTSANGTSGVKTASDNVRSQNKND